MPDHLTITVTESADGATYIVESDVEATNLTAICAMTSGLLSEANRIHDNEHYLDGVKN